MKRPWLTALATPLAAHAVFGSFEVAVRDEATGKPVDGAIVIAREFATVGKIHGSDTYCVRADVAVFTGRSITMDLPFAGSDTTPRAKGIEAIAYQPGYCLGRTASAARISDYNYDPRGPLERLKEIDTSAETRLGLRRAEQDPQERLLYLKEVLPAFLCSANRWSARSEASFQRFRQAIVAEARAIARTRYEKVLAATLEETAPAASTAPTNQRQHDVMGSITNTGFHPFNRDFIIAPANARVSWNDAGLAGISTTTQSTGAAIHCRHGEPSKCDLNERNHDGETALYVSANANKANEVRLLLEAGADPNIPPRPNGITAIDIAINHVKGPHPEYRAGAVEVLDLLAADPRTTITQKLKEDFAADPATWTQVADAKVRELLAARREAVAKLPVRTARKPGCEAPGYADAFLTRYLPARLRSLPY